MTCTITSIPEGQLDNGNKEKRLKYNDGYQGSDEFKYSSVKKTLILAIFPELSETHFNMNSLLKELKLESLDYSMSQDIKMMLILVRKQPASSKHPCPYCESETPKLLSAKNNTIRSLLNWLECFEHSGSDKTHACIMLSQHT